MEAAVFEWALRPELWLLVGIVAALCELATGTMILLPLGCTAILVSGYLALQVYEMLPVPLWLHSWKGVALLYCVLAVPTLLLLRKLFQNRTKRQDINKY